jgi:hypothetical protein
MRRRCSTIMITSMEERRSGYRFGIRTSLSMLAGTVGGAAGVLLVCLLLAGSLLPLPGPKSLP